MFNKILLRFYHLKPKASKNNQETPKINIPVAGGPGKDLVACVDSVGADAAACLQGSRGLLWLLGYVFRFFGAWFNAANMNMIFTDTVHIEAKS